MLRVLEQPDARRTVLIAGGLALGATLAFALSGGSWLRGALGIGFVLAVLAGLAQRCSA